MVNNPTQKDIPAFFSPLTHDEHARLGRIAILWGQADMYLDNFLPVALGLDPEIYMQLLGEKPFGAKLDHLKKALPKLGDEQARAAVHEFVKKAYTLKMDRNRCFHGVWGFFISKRKVEAAAQFQKTMEKPFKASELPRLERSLCQLSHLGMLAMAALGVHEELVGAQPLYHGGDPRQEWFQEWREQHFEGRHTLGRNWKPGRLPYLEHPLK